MNQKIFKFGSIEKMLDVFIFGNFPLDFFGRIYYNIFVIRKNQKRRKKENEKVSS